VITTMRGTKKAVTRGERAPRPDVERPPGGDGLDRDAFARQSATWLRRGDAVALRAESDVGDE
jgi:hypothetical protein